MAVGDVHGAADPLLALLRRCGLVDAEGDWRGGDAILVQTGDFTDRGPAVRRVMDLLMRLQDQAAAAGGEVVVLLGNHEAMNLVGDWRYVSQETLADFVDAESAARRRAAADALARLAAVQAGEEPELVRRRWLAEHPPGFVEYVEALSPDGSYGRWLRRLPATWRSDGIVFLHGGLGREAATLDLDEIDRRVREEIETSDRARRQLVEEGAILPFEPLERSFEVARQRVVEMRAQAARRRISPTRWKGDEYRVLRAYLELPRWTILAPDGPLWFRGYARWDERQGVEALTEVLDELEAERLVVGHSPRAGGAIEARFGGRALLIDTGMLGSHYPGGRASALEIRGGRARAVYLDGEEEIPWGDLPK